MYKISKKIYISDFKSVKDVLIQSVKDVLIQMCQGCSDTWHLVNSDSSITIRHKQNYKKYLQMA